ncbi:UDP-4-amino-4,6-dideoxy-N-acetyl-beta-L-altrosamine N-acetyltransferase [Gottfriedia acidiceleris]|uniref:UDP-4-amino-4, 6-dideoxy-N-acetyl-beta-L-altrosamine N-acetyltransferase n=1 Tax=Gottfriedia acidiceleris TaxID=371036 RepID=UPI00101C835C|nr:UDP-4-amino-4,6-dideoxy-N-acetyl-beta-L-altrosamine N-acetyltransferase [Gottfriedia acidiceleris]
MIRIEDFKLKDIELRDLNILFTWRNTERIRSVMINDEVITYSQHSHWFRSLKDDPTKIAKIFLYKNLPIGFIQFTNINKLNGTCEWGFYIGENTTPRGFGTIMGILALDYLFNELKMRKLSASILDFNVTSINYHKKLGFTKEGRLLKQYIKNKSFIDLVLMGLFKESWYKHSEQLKKEVFRDSERDNNRE